MRWLTFVIVNILFISSWEVSASPFFLPGTGENADLNDHWYYFRDPTGKSGLSEVTALINKENFQPSDGNLNFGITGDTIWLRVEIKRAAVAPTEWWLEVAPAYLSEATVYLAASNAENSPAFIGKAGISLPFSYRELKARNSTFKIPLDNLAAHFIYLKLRSNSQMNIRASLWQPAAFAEKIAFENLILGMYYGAFFIIFVTSVVQWLQKRNKTDFWWMIYLFAEGFLTFRMNGLASIYIFPELPFLNNFAATASISLMVLAGANFGVHAFSIKKEKNKYLFNTAIWIGNIAPVIGMIRVFFPSEEMTAVLYIFPVVLCLLNCIFSVKFFKSGQTASIIYLIGIWFMSVCLMLVLSRNFGIIPAYEFIDYVWQSNLLIHTSLMSIGIVLSRKESIKAKLKENEFRQVAEFNLNMTQMQKRMLAIVSHEFRNALTMVNVSMHALRKYKDLPPAISQKHENIARIHHKMRKIIDDFLLDERIENAKINLFCSDTKIHVLINEVINISMLMGKGHCISCDLKEVPQSLFLDEAILRLTLTNLLDNAVKYSPANSNISVEVFCDNEVLKISVTDDGIGMTLQSLTQIFSPHFKADRQSDGVGIGLHLVRKMVNAHCGEINVSSAIGKGTRVDFYLKIKCRDEDSKKIAAVDTFNH